MIFFLFFVLVCVSSGSNFATLLVKFGFKLDHVWNPFKQFVLCCLCVLCFLFLKRLLFKCQCINEHKCNDQINALTLMETTHQCGVLLQNWWCDCWRKLDQRVLLSSPSSPPPHTVFLCKLLLIPSVRTSHVWWFELSSNCNNTSYSAVIHKNTPIKRSKSNIPDTVFQRDCRTIFPLCIPIFLCNILTPTLVTYKLG